MTALGVPSRLVNRVAADFIIMAGSRLLVQNPEILQ